MVDLGCSGMDVVDSGSSGTEVDFGYSGRAVSYFGMEVGCNCCVGRSYCSGKEVGCSYSGAVAYCFDRVACYNCSVDMVIGCDYSGRVVGCSDTVAGCSYSVGLVCYFGMDAGYNCSVAIVSYIGVRSSAVLASEASVGCTAVHRRKAVAAVRAPDVPDCSWASVG